MGLEDVGIEKFQCNESLGDCRTLVDIARIF